MVATDQLSATVKTHGKVSACVHLRFGKVPIQQCTAAAGFYYRFTAALMYSGNNNK